MGWETALFLGLNAMSAVSQMNSAKEQANATVAEGNIAASNKAKDVARMAASQRVSFLNSGLTLEGTPMGVIESTFNTGLQDINQISSNYNTRAKGQISAGRSAAISTLASSFAGASMPGMGDGIGKSLSFGTNSMNGVGQAFNSGFDTTAMGPFNNTGPRIFG